ncbi:alpha/beta family hydrolase [Wenyingzhuangia sp. IMCC45467]
MKKNKMFFLIEREDWLKDTDLKNKLLHHLKGHKHKIKWEDPAGNLIYKLRTFENKNIWIPLVIKKLNLRVLQSFYVIFHWNYFKYLANRNSRNKDSKKLSTIEIRIKLLKQRILNYDKNYELFIISRSAGGRFASLVADELNIKHIICLSYPFQNPHNGIEPDRYLHLENLKTPMTIFQGDKDEYGGLEIRDKYKLSDHIDLQFVDANHDFNLNTKDWERVLTKIDTILKTA